MLLDMSIDPNVDWEQVREQEPHISFIPALSRDRFRLVETYSLPYDQPLPLVASPFHTDFSLSSRERDGARPTFLLRGVENSGLSPNGAFPDALSQYRDGFLIAVTQDDDPQKREARIAPLGGDSSDEGTILGVDGLIAVKNILWTSTLPGGLITAEAIAARRGTREIAHAPTEGFKPAWDAYNGLDSAARMIDFALQNNFDLCGAVPQKVFEEIQIDFSDHDVENYAADGDYKSLHLLAWVFRTPEYMYDIVPEEARIHMISINFTECVTFFDVYGIPVNTSYAEFHLDPQMETVYIDPQDDDIGKSRLDDDSTYELAQMINAITPLPTSI